jgi:hypothetical protein
VTDTVGRCQAASDWEDPGTPLGADLSFRPYVRDALEHGRGLFYGIGVTSHRAGYYLSYVLMQQGRPYGDAPLLPLAIERGRYLRSERLLAPVGWRLIVLDDLAPRRTSWCTPARCRPAWCTR